MFFAWIRSVICTSIIRIKVYVKKKKKERIKKKKGNQLKTHALKCQCSLNDHPLIQSYSWIYWLPGERVWHSAITPLPPPKKWILIFDKKKNKNREARYCTDVFFVPAYISFARNNTAANIRERLGRNTMVCAYYSPLSLRLSCVACTNYHVASQNPGCNGFLVISIFILWLTKHKKKKWRKPYIWTKNRQRSDILRLKLKIF